MRKFIDTNKTKTGSLSGYRYLQGRDVEFLIFDNGPKIFIKSLYSDKWSETTGSLIHSSDANRKYSGVNVYDKYIKDFKVWLGDKECFFEYGGFTYGALQKKSINITDTCEYVALPHRSVLDAIYQVGDEFIIIAREEFIKQYTPSVWKGNLVNGIRELEIKKYERYLDGGTTHITTQEGDIHCPSLLTRDIVENVFTDITGVKTIMNKLDVASIADTDVNNIMLPSIKVHIKKLKN